jgi:hypothetical protein
MHLRDQPRTVKTQARSGIGLGRVVITMLLGLLWVLGPEAASGAVGRTTTAPGQTPLRPDFAALPSLGSKAVTTLSHLPVSFEANRGQFDRRVAFAAHGPGYTLFLTSSGTMDVLQAGLPRQQYEARTERQLGQMFSPAPPRKQAVVRFHFVRANPRPRIVGLNELPGKVNYFLGNDPHQWHTNIPTYARVEYQDIYPGINLVYSSRNGRLEYDWIVRPGGNPTLIKLLVEGGRHVRLDGADNLVLESGVGLVRQSKPVIYQRRGGRKHIIAGGYVLRGQQAHFRVGAYDVQKPLVIDPSLTYSTYLGGSDYDAGHGIAVDSSGNAYVTGFTLSTNFPPRNPLQPASGAPADAFVTKLNASGTGSVYTTYLGGNGADEGSGIAIDSAGSAYVTGNTLSTNFPTQNSVQAASGGDDDAFVAKLDPSGGVLVYSTYLGGRKSDGGEGIAVDRSGDAYVTGATTSAHFPTHNPLQPTNDGGYLKAFVTELNAAGSALVYSTYLGGSSGDGGYSIALDSAGNAYVTGSTASTDFPIQNPVQAAYGGAGDAFVSELNAGGTALGYSTYLGGSGQDTGYGIAVSSSGNAYVTGYTQSTDFPTTSGSFQTSHSFSCNAWACGSTAFVTKLSIAGSLVYSTYLGGSGSDEGHGIAVDGSGNAYVAGLTLSTDFPTQDPVQAAKNGDRGDAFATKLDASGRVLLYSTYLGGTDFDEAFGLTVDSTGSAYVTGDTRSANFPTQTPLQAANSGADDAFIVKIGAAPLDGAATIALSQGVGFPTSLRLLTGSGFAPNEQVEAFWSSPTGILFGKTTIDANGAFSGSAPITFRVPIVPAGTYTVYAVGQSSGTAAMATMKVVPMVRISPTSGPAGSAAMVSGMGYGPYESVTIRWDCGAGQESQCAGAILGTALTDENGTFSALLVTIPAGAISGSYEIGGKGGTTRLYADVTVSVTS